MMKYNAGLNFSQSKYRIISKNAFIPHIRSNLRVSIPREILENFKGIDKEIALVRITDITTKNKRIRIKKLQKEANSYTISFKAEKNFKKPQIELLNIKSKKGATSREKENPFSMNNFIPKYTKYTTKTPTPIYVFNYNNKLIVGGYYKKDLIIKKEINFNRNVSEALGLYFADGGKTAASFTNSWPKAINLILDFMENLFNLKREEIRASIYCNYNLKNKQIELEQFWNEHTGIANFSRTLHFSKNSKSPQGTLELYFCSEVIKSIMLELINHVNDYPFKKRDFIRGFLSGDGSPIKQTKYSLTHHIVFDGKEREYYTVLLKNIFDNYNIKFRNNRAVIFSSQKDNIDLLFNDVYKFNNINRLKFIERFFSLPSTIKLMKKDKNLQKFKNIAYKESLLELKQIHSRLINLKITNKKFEDMLLKWQIN